MTTNTYSVYAHDASGYDRWEAPDFCEKAEDARLLAVTLSTEGGYYDVWVQGEGVNEHYQAGQVVGYGVGDSHYDGRYEKS